ncbi:pyruvate kinase [Hydrogenimonas cancrithermarum]|uniref:Pyruvate kinase n=1 Tax=Hydrogenimonas cancrithermarum TaxID=2993563 RepID=A0ABM8FJE8_9BACT|nr:pyruvate kinase [Hydrogenimonas cancrithermarum]BDY11734.1 hypothetical protein HCR_00460 [Hydrogenimonas cancrithermarum]
MIAKVKIVATLGPSTNTRESIAELIDRGVNVFRLNFSYGTYDEHSETIRAIREIAEEKSRQIGILQDICGPKIRITGLEKPIEVKRGDRLRVSRRPREEAFSLTYPEIVDALRIGDKIFFSDGTVQTRVVGHDSEEKILEVMTPGRLMNGKGVNFPEADITLHALTQKDREDIRFGAQMGVDFLAVSFVSSEKDIAEARSILHESGGSAWVIAKIERKSALTRLEAIVEASDGVMVARGDLGAEAGFSHVPVLQKEIIRMCNLKGKPVITATQMLTSMIHSPYPTRAEVSDIANALFDGTDAVMLSDETAVGEYPFKAVDVLIETIVESQKFYPYSSPFMPEPREAFPHAAAELSSVLASDLIVALTLSGYTLRHLSKFRPQKPLYAISTDSALVNKTTLVWGCVSCVTIENFSNEKELVEKFLKSAKIDPETFLLVTGYLGEKISLGKSVRYIDRTHQ